VAGFRFGWLWSSSPLTNVKTAVPLSVFVRHFRFVTFIPTVVFATGVGSTI